MRQISLLLILGLILIPVSSHSQNRCDSNVSIVQTEGLICYYPHFSKIDLVVGTMPSKEEKSVIFVCAGSFTGSLLETFKHSNIAGDHVCSGKYYNGFHCGPNNGVFTWSESSGWHYYNNGHKNSVVPLKQIAAEGGMGFCQSLLILNGKQFTGCFKKESVNQYRALCEINGELCIVDCSQAMAFGEFLNNLKTIGVKNAIYCDMGRGWNYSWYREDNGKVKELFKIPGRYTTNWITFYK